MYHAKLQSYKCRVYNLYLWSIVRMNVFPLYACNFYNLVGKLQIDNTTSFDFIILEWNFCRLINYSETNFISHLRVQETHKYVFLWHVHLIGIMNSKKEKSELYILTRKFDLELAWIDVVTKFHFRLNLILRKLACTAYCYIFFYRKWNATHSVKTKRRVEFRF